MYYFLKKIAFKTKKIFYLLISVYFLASCSTNKHKYLSDLHALYDTVNQANQYPNKAPNYRINSDDRIYIKILTLDKEASKFFNNQENSSTNNMNTQNMMFIGYVVDSDGYIDLPILKKVKIINLTLEELQLTIQEKANEYLKDATVIVKLLSFNVFFIGEINSSISTYNNQLNILDAISMAGGIPYTADKENIVIIRSTKIGREAFKINLTKERLLSSKSFYLQPNDIIHVVPLDSKTFNVTMSEYLLYLTTITSTITSLLLVISFLK